MITSDVMTVPHDARFTFKHEVKQGRSGIISGEKSTIGKVTFNPGATCRHDDSCYVGFRLPSRRKFVPNFDPRPFHIIENTKILKFLIKYSEK